MPPFALPAKPIPPKNARQGVRQISNGEKYKNPGKGGKRGKGGNDKRAQTAKGGGGGKVNGKRPSDATRTGPHGERLPPPVDDDDEYQASEFSKLLNIVHEPRITRSNQSAHVEDNS